MCGIVGILGNEPVALSIVEALRRLEYRGYDSSGVATLENGAIKRRRAPGKLRGEVDLGKPRWLPKPSAVNVQGLASFDPHKLARRMGELNPVQNAEVKTAIRDLLGL